MKPITRALISGYFWLGRVISTEHSRYIGIHHRYIRPEQNLAGVGMPLNSTHLSLGVGGKSNDFSKTTMVYSSK